MVTVRRDSMRHIAAKVSAQPTTKKPWEPNEWNPCRCFSNGIQKAPRFSLGNSSIHPVSGDEHLRRPHLCGSCKPLQCSKSHYGVRALLPILGVLQLLGSLCEASRKWNTAAAKGMSLPLWRQSETAQSFLWYTLCFVRAGSSDRMVFQNAINMSFKGAHLRHPKPWNQESSITETKQFSSSLQKQLFSNTLTLHNGTLHSIAA